MKNKRAAVRFRINANGLQVWNFGKWINADEQISTNVVTALRNLFPVEQLRAA